MGWFQRLCRDTGLMVHHIVKPAPAAGAKPGAETREVKRTVEEQQVSPTVTLRRTTIEEVEIKRGDPNAG